MEKKLIIFDCYGTLLNHPEGKAYSTLFSAIGLNLKEHYKTIMTKKENDWSQFVDFNKVTKETYNMAIRNFKIDVEREAYNVKPYIENTQELLKELREKYTVAILSNLAVEYTSPITNHLSSFVDKVFYSYEIEEMKPNANSFIIVKQWYVENYGDIENRHIMVVDDSFKNIHMANSINMIGISINNGNINSPNSIKSFFEWTLNTQIY